MTKDKKNPHKLVKTRSGIKIPAIIYGTAWKKERTADLVIRAVQNGFRGIDTACQPKHYNEYLVGEGLKRLYQNGISRSELYIQSKFTPVNGQAKNSIPYDAAAPLAEQITQSLTVSLHNLKTDYLDALILHSPLYPLENTLTAWRAMEQMVEKKKVRLLGISNCYDLGLLQYLEQNVTIPLSIVQNRFYHETGYDIKLRKWCDTEHIIYQSFWSLTANPHLLQSEQVLSAARTHGKTGAQILFRYLTHNNIVPLTGTTSTVHMIEDLAIFDFSLSDAERIAIDQLLQ